MTRARRAVSDRIVRLRVRRSSSVRSSVVNVSAIWRRRVPVLRQAVQATRLAHVSAGPEYDMTTADTAARILIVDDDESVLQTFSKALALEGFDVRVAAS